MMVTNIIPEHQTIGKRPKWVFDNSEWDSWTNEIDKHSWEGNSSAIEEVKAFSKMLINTSENHYKKTAIRSTPNLTKYGGTNTVHVQLHFVEGLKIEW